MVCWFVKPGKKGNKSPRKTQLQNRKHFTTSQKWEAIRNTYGNLLLMSNKLFAFCISRVKANPSKIINYITFTYTDAGDILSAVWSLEP